MNAVPAKNYPFYFETEDEILNASMSIMEQKMKSYAVELTSSSLVKNYVKSRLNFKDREVFLVIFLNTKNQLIYAEEVFSGSLNACAIYPRVVAKLALLADAGAVILAHNHPSGDTTPSEADKKITTQLIECLELFDINVLDHIIVGDGDCFSFAEAGIMR